MTMVIYFRDLNCSASGLVSRRGLCERCSGRLGQRLHLSSSLMKLMPWLLREEGKIDCIRVTLDPNWKQYSKVEHIAQFRVINPHQC